MPYDVRVMVLSVLDTRKPAKEILGHVRRL